MDYQDYMDRVEGIATLTTPKGKWLYHKNSWEPIEDRSWWHFITHPIVSLFSNDLIPWLAHHKSILAVIVLMTIMFILWPVDTNIK
jgi:hypothetical protein